MIERDYRRPGYLLGGSDVPGREPTPKRFIAGNDAPQTYTDRKAARGFDDAPLDIRAIVKIQQLDCQGHSREAILRALAAEGISMEQISRVLNPEPAERRQERAGVGFAGVKARLR